MFIRPKNAVEYLRKEASSCCSHPYHMKHYDYNLKKMVDVEVDCGVCDYCRYKHQQQWVKRMEMESSPLINKNCYFITLTLDKDFLKKHKAFAREFYSVKRYGEVIPLLLSRHQLQLFIARLRKNNPTKRFTYFACGEYGETYSRPHYHLILWSDDDFQKSDIDKAWSIDGDSIGITNFHNLVENGTLSKLRSDSISCDEALDSKSMFKYVAKYVNKMPAKDLLDEMYTKNLIKVAFKKYYIKVTKFDKPLNRDMTHKGEHYFRSKLKNIINKNTELQEYEKYIHDNTKTTVYEYKTVEDFFNQFLPYQTSSTSNSIGTRYVERLVRSTEDLINGVNDPYTGAHLVLPKSFARKVERQITPIVPLSWQSNLPQYGEMHRVDSLLHLLQTHDFKKYDQDYWLNDFIGQFYVGDGQLFHLNKTGVRCYDFATGQYLQELTYIEFRDRLNLEKYIEYMKLKQGSYRAFYEAKVAYIAEEIEMQFHSQDYQEWCKEQRRNKKQQLAKQQQAWLFKHKLNKFQ